MRVTAIHQTSDRREAYGDRLGRPDELDLARGMMFGSVLGAFVWGVLAGIVWFCI